MIIDSLVRFIILIPIFGFGSILLLDEKTYKENIKFVAIWTVFFALSISLVILSKIDPSYSVVTTLFGIGLSINYLTISLLALSSFLLLISLLISKDEIQRNIKKYYVATIVLEEIFLLIFLSTDIVMFQILSDALWFIIFLLFGISTEETLSSIKIFLFLALSSFISLTAVIYIIHLTGITEINVLSKYNLDTKNESFIFLALLFNFLIKAAIVPFHIWISNISKRAPIALLIIFCLVLLVGSFGFFNILAPLTKHLTKKFKYFVITLGFISIIYSTFLALIQNNLKKIIPYIAIINSSLILIGVFSGIKESISGAFFSMISGNIAVLSLFSIVYVLNKYTKSLNIDTLSNGPKRSRALLFISIIPVLDLLFIPPFPAFVGEFSILFGLFNSHYLASATLAFLMTGALFYLLYPYQKIFLTKETSSKITLERYDLWCVLPPVFVIFVLTIFSNYFMKAILRSIQRMNISVI